MLKLKQILRVIAPATSFYYATRLQDPMSENALISRAKHLFILSVILLANSITVIVLVMH